MLEFLTFAIGFVALLVAIAAFVIGDRDQNRQVRYLLGGLFFLIAIPFCLIGTFAFLGNLGVTTILPSVGQGSDTIDTVSPLQINGRSYTAPSGLSGSPYCVADEFTGFDTQVDYNLVVPDGWVIVWDSHKAYWPGGQYEQDGLLTIYGGWEGEVRIVAGRYCAVPAAWSEYAIDLRRNAYEPFDRRIECYIGNVSNVGCGYPE